MKVHRKSISSPRIEMLPLIDIVFLLLVFFIYAMLSMAVHHGQPVDLPDSTGAVLEPDEAIGITIQDMGDTIRLHVNEQPVRLEELSAVLREQAGEEREQEVKVFADRTVAYQELFRVLDRIRQAGLSRISLQARPEEVASP
ncbi:hypothetical protein GF1_27640 [Desulfolithobacter dissulfuricans]|uniref:Biopolymer transporter ExbD n=1 Tax=Desulfolithobacter dissulfuricans TaxID=2795293 RepID=A0A915U2Y9_9BACT|nr:biopolymer transporter ExbD [Desulfolithobacter dissulfuricans]BCO10388.1 hypothetical protein GF1_27640 [Desulfolithobacter dissulfuricans]